MSDVLKRPRAPEWLHWENAVAEMNPAARMAIKSASLQFVDYTDDFIVLDGKNYDFEGDANLAKELARIFPWAGAKVLFTPIEWAACKYFTEGRKWRVARYATFLSQGNWCRCCGSRPPNVEVHVDHIVPRSIDPSLALELSNLQVLCRDCNVGKGNGDSKDWRVTSNA